MARFSIRDFCGSWIVTDKSMIIPDIKVYDNGEAAVFICKALNDLYNRNMLVKNVENAIGEFLAS